MGKKQRFSPPAVGGSSLLVVFAVLCLTVFALLSLSTVQASRQLAETSASSVRAYYEADCRAEEILARLRSGQLPEGVFVQNDEYWYTCPISDTQDLQVRVRLEGTACSVLQWQAVSTVDWEADQGLDLWDGGPTG